MFSLLLQRDCTLGVGQEAVEKRDGCARGDSDGVVLREAVSRGNTCTPREMMESGIVWWSQEQVKCLGGGGARLGEYCPPLAMKTA